MRPEGGGPEAGDFGAGPVGGARRSSRFGTEECYVGVGFEFFFGVEAGGEREVGFGEVYGVGGEDAASFDEVFYVVVKSRVVKEEDGCGWFYNFVFV